MKNLSAYLWLIPALPLLAAGLGALTPRRGRTFASGAAIAALGGSLVLSILALRLALQLAQMMPGQPLVFNFTWFELGDGAVRLGWLLDPLTAFMCVMVSFVGLLIFIFSLGYMREDENFTRFFCFLSLFAAAMLGVLVSNSLLLLFICWELVGLASYLLIGFWFHKPEAAAAAKKAFIVTRIGDIGFLLGMLWLYHSTDTLLFYDDGQGCLEYNCLSALSGHFAAGGLALSTAIGLLIFCGAMGKSGQFPLHVWLPDAMEGPTPVSALIHAATMVAAGVFLIARVFPLMQADQFLAAVPLHALPVVAFIGAITALMGACIAVAQTDIKRVLAFSTISQLGYMMLALGVGSWTAAIFHLLTHAFFKALLFLCAGSVIHAAHHEQDMRRLGGLSIRMRVTFATFAIGMLALSGFPFIFSGFWSKEAILMAAGEWNVSQLPFFMGLAAVVLTAFYMTRLLAEIFLGQPRTAVAAHAHESPAVMTVPLVILAVFAVVLGFIGTPAWPWLQAQLTGQPVVSGHLIESGPKVLLSITLVGIGLGVGWTLYGRRPRAATAAPDPLRARAPGLFAFLEGQMKFNEFYAATFGKLIALAARLADGLDQMAIGRMVSLLGRGGEIAGQINRRGDEQGLNAGFDSASETLRESGQAYSYAQTGQAHGYLRTIAIAFAVLVFLAFAGGCR
ncbi:MAG TPA: NADH-quinone oxidoreductase subunit L [Opitutaceae bacterium]|nr:NADH-quinone oxidoreductase subunit L [Opitutaceae bacterium]